MMVSRSICLGSWWPVFQRIVVSSRGRASQ
jgi:hypothetical protein